MCGQVATCPYGVELSNNATHACVVGRNKAFRAQARECFRHRQPHITRNATWHFSLLGLQLP